MRGIGRDLAKAARLARDVPRFLGAPIAAGAARAAVTDRLRRREERFLHLCERAIYANSASPYRRLLAAAGCEPGDVRALVEREGLEGTLASLVRAGVYLTFEEFKGRREVVRGSFRMTCAEAEFDNPLVTPHLEAVSGGSRGPGTSVKLALSYFADLAPGTSLALETHGLAEHAHAVWLQGFSAGYVYAALGRPVLGWFHQAPLPLRHRLVHRYVRALGRVAGRRLPGPQLVDVAEPERIAAWLAARQREGAMCLTTYASSAVRICLAAVERGLSLDRTAFVTLGEPFTEAKRLAIERAGARALVRYAFTEAGIVGYGCVTPDLPDDVHFLADSYGLVQRERAVGAAGLSVDAFLFTSLLPSAPKILLNVESGDHGVVQERDCGCALGAAGLRRHLTTIRSFEKLSSEGMTFVRTDLLRVLEETLPARFGGAGTDYQVLEEEATHGILRLLLVVSPAVGPVDEAQVRHVFLDGVAGAGAAEELGAAVWRQAGTVHVRRAWPVATRAGKILPFHLASR